MGKFNPPSKQHDLLIKVVKKAAQQRKADCQIHISGCCDKKNPLDYSKKIQYLKSFFPHTDFIQNDKSVADTVKTLTSKYKNVIIVSSQKIPEKIKKLDAVEVISVDTDADNNDLIKCASKGDYAEFKKDLPLMVRDLDGKRLMNDIRSSMGLEPIKEQINLVKNELREKYFRGEIFNEGEFVECDETLYKIIKRGSNHLLLQNESGKKVSKWVQDVTTTERQFMENKIYEADTTAGGSINANKEAEKAKKESEKAQMQAQFAKEREALAATQERKKQAFAQTSARAANEAVESPVVDKKSNYNIARSIMSLKDFQKTAGMKPAGVSKETESDHDAAYQNVDHQSVGDKSMGRDPEQTLRRMKAHYHLGEGKGTYAGLEKEDKPGKVKTEFKGGKNAVSGDTVEGFKDEDIGFKHTKTTAVKEEQEFADWTEEDILAVQSDLDAWSDDDVIEEAYDDEELAIIDDETGEFIEDVAEPNSALMEVLSRQERLRARIRLKQTAPKRNRAHRVALKVNSTPEVANRRARRMAVSAMKKRLSRGRTGSQLSIGEKERIERFVQQRRNIINRLAARMVSRVKQVEKSRLHHTKFTRRSNNGVTF